MRSSACYYVLGYASACHRVPLRAIAWQCVCGSACVAVRVQQCVCGSTWQCVAVRVWQCVCGSACAAVRVRQCLCGSVWQCVAVRAVRAGARAPVRSDAC